MRYPRTYTQRALSALTVTALILVVGLTVRSPDSARAGAAADRPAASLEARLRAVEDYQAVQQLLAAYMTHMDADDWTAYSLLFSADGELIFQTHDEKGPEAIRALMSKSMSRSAVDSAPVRAAVILRHTLTNIDIHIDGDHATDTARWTVMSKGPDGRPSLGATGHYVDTLVRTNGAWKFQRRVIYTDIPFDDPLADLGKAATK